MHKACMHLTIEEFCQFNIKSKLQLIQKDGELKGVRSVVDLFVIKLYKVFKFYIEVVFDVIEQKIVSIEPVINADIFNLYNIKTT